MNKKELVVKYRGLINLACGVYNLPGLFRRHLKGSAKIRTSCSMLKNVSFHIKGQDNEIIIEDFCRLKNCSIIVSGNHNRIVIGRWSTLLNAELCIENSGNEILLGEHTRILGKTHLAAIEGTKIVVGKDSMFSSDIHFRTGDSHSILNLEGKRINASGDIVIGEHVWVGTKVTCLKGARVPDHSIVGACALVTGAFDKPNCVLAGVPAKVVKEQVDWSIHRVPVGEIPPDFVIE